MKVIAVWDPVFGPLGGFTVTPAVVVGGALLSGVVEVASRSSA
ncbi:MAG: hypothetical protein U0802_05905 [Candidatus Binatia bacterium]